MQRKNHSIQTFSERTDLLSERLGVSLRDLAPIIGISQAMLFGYRTGKYSPSNKALGKLMALEAKVEPESSPENMRGEIHSDKSAQNQSTEPSPDYAGHVERMLAAGPDAAVKKIPSLELLERVAEDVGRMMGEKNAIMRAAYGNQVIQWASELHRRCETLGDAEKELE